MERYFTPTLNLKNKNCPLSLRYFDMRAKIQVVTPYYFACEDLKEDWNTLLIQQQQQQSQSPPSSLVTNPTKSSLPNGVGKSRKPNSIPLEPKVLQVCKFPLSRQQICCDIECVLLCFDTLRMCFSICSVSPWVNINTDSSVRLCRRDGASGGHN